MQRQPRVRLTTHCQARLLDRNITEAQVRHVALHPEGIFEDIVRVNFKCYASINNPPYPDEPFLLIIYKRNNNEIVVITTMWKSKGGLIAIGFNNL